MCLNGKMHLFANATMGVLLPLSVGSVSVVKHGYVAGRHSVAGISTASRWRMRHGIQSRQVALAQPSNARAPDTPPNDAVCPLQPHSPPSPAWSHRMQLLLQRCRDRQPTIRPSSVSHLITSLTARSKTARGPSPPPSRGPVSCCSSRGGDCLLQRLRHGSIDKFPSQQRIVVHV